MRKNQSTFYHYCFGYADKWRRNPALSTAYINNPETMENENMAARSAVMDDDSLEFPQARWKQDIISGIPISEGLFCTIELVTNH